MGNCCWYWRRFASWFCPSARVARRRLMAGGGCAIQQNGAKCGRIHLVNRSYPSTLPSGRQAESTGYLSFRTTGSIQPSSERVVPYKNSTRFRLVGYHPSPSNFTLRLFMGFLGT
jgi:hypothetical protein